ncbi:hypothetical protein DBR42_00150 [Pelomonas sp. HMWF004]|nr:hypothetical protein DBR42_00150 [Pelomonas sp. HMWF004]
MTGLAGLPTGSREGHKDATADGLQARLGAAYGAERGPRRGFRAPGQQKHLPALPVANFLLQNVRAAGLDKLTPTRREVSSRLVFAGGAPAPNAGCRGNLTSVPVTMESALQNPFPATDGTRSRTVAADEIARRQVRSRFKR